MKANNVIKAGCVAVCLGMTSQNLLAITFADSVVDVSPGSGSGVVITASGPTSYVGPVGEGTFDATAITLGLDGVSYALGGDDAITPQPGSVIVAFTTGVVLDGAGADLIIHDSFGLTEGFVVDASSDGVSWSTVGTFTGLTGETVTTSPSFLDGDLYSTYVDISPSGMSAASHFRLTANYQVVYSYPQALDLDAVEAIYFRPSGQVPEAASTLLLMGISLMGLAALRNKAA